MKLDRRTLSSRILKIIALSPFAGVALKALAKSKVKMVSLKDPTAVALKYVTDKSKIDKATQKAAAQKGMAFAKQTCANCMLYAPSKTKVDGKEVGNCNMLPGKGYVPADAWCNGWVKNPKAK